MDLPLIGMSRKKLENHFINKPAKMKIRKTTGLIHLTPANNRKNKQMSKIRTTSLPTIPLSSPL
jgi:hypothetical protein